MMMQDKPKVVLLACGSFNPITNMHLRMFELARDYLHSTKRYQVIGGIISPVSDGYGKKGLLTAKHRCEMLQRALQTSDWIRLDTWESDQTTWTETRKVLQHHQNLFDSIVNGNKSSSNLRKKQKLDYDKINANTIGAKVSSPTWDLSQPVQVKLLCGADLLESFGVPKLWKDEDIADIVGNFGLVVITRKGSNPQRFIYESDVLTKYQWNIHLVTEWITNDISSTKIRRALRRGESVRYLLQDAVIQYIKDQKLYQDPHKDDPTHAVAEILYMMGRVLGCVYKNSRNLELTGNV
ncbi:nicotinamide/nicotinic acid mononucleotide adenylyltransferase 1-like isoform X2 [Limulus polyphemus]|uniref:Nicotinamide-nucleotide adenylyltransferase n=1 Tax=Limulus polyphemus TaxID=6850 RepID=A0ABM1TM12_LIMPO|nr:nicotinamide/nicotinic acid mononucleotide adenylyltransferase 1-like isoform X2 [Limulus polyphemus]